MESVWFLFWWCPLLSVDCFHKLCLSGTPSENSQVGWDLGNRMARGYRFDAKWVCPMGSYAWGIQVFCLRNEVPPQFSNRIEHKNTSSKTSHGTDSFRVKLQSPKISAHLAILLFSEGVPERQSLWKQSTNKRGQLSEEKSDWFHTKCSIELWTILMFELLLCCHAAAWCMERT